MTEPKDLCGRCAAMLQEGYDLKRVGGGVDHKVTCSHWWAAGATGPPTR